MSQQGEETFILNWAYYYLVWTCSYPTSESVMNELVNLAHNNLNFFFLFLQR